MQDEELADDSRVTLERCLSRLFQRRVYEIKGFKELENRRRYKSENRQAAPRPSAMVFVSSTRRKFQELKRRLHRTGSQV